MEGVKVEWREMGCETAETPDPGQPDPIRSRGPELSNNANKHRHLPATAGAQVR
jgi:hypothetical protein